jgi:dTDP-4-dehydrorhamnose reductase
MTKYLIIGHHGTLGSQFQRMLGDQAMYADRNELDITDQLAVNKFITEHQPEIIINCAAYNAVDKAEEEPEIANLINGTAVGYLSAAASAAGAIFVHYSTNYVFRGDKREGYTEDETPNPQSAYARSKALGEQEALRHNPKSYVIRSALLYGQQGPSASSKRSFVETALWLAKEKPNEIKMVSDQYAQPTWVKDLAEFTLQLLNEGAPYGIYHGTNSGSASWYTWAQEIYKIAGLDIKIQEASMADFTLPEHSAQRPQFGVLLSTKRQAMRPWQEALKEYLQ